MPRARELTAALQSGSTTIEEGVEEAPRLDWAGNPIRQNEYGLDIIWTYEPPEQLERPVNLQWVRVHAFHIFLVATFGGTALIMLATYLLGSGEKDDNILGLSCTTQWKDLFKYLSIPLVSVLFTWWHVWLGIWLCFNPLEFVGCCPPVCGWQGIVPRRAEVMAGRSCDIMIGRLLKIEEIIDRIEEKSFFDELQPVLVNTTTVVLENLAKRKVPGTWQKTPEWAKREIENAILETAPAMFNPAIEDVKRNIHQILDVKQMAIQILVENKPLLVEMFQKIGEREFTFIQHFSAVLGFVCGLIQMLVWIGINGGGADEEECKTHGSKFHCWAGFLILPLSGLIIGYLTNWLGINLIFRPVWPHHYCGGYLNIQGVFLKRQQQVAKEMTKMICEHLVTAHKMLEFVLTRDEIISRVQDIFTTHIEAAIEKSTQGVERVVKWIPKGRAAMESFNQGLKEDVVKEMLVELPNHSKKIEDYMDNRFDLANLLSYRLSRLPPDQFEGMLHPVFQEDEWMVLLLGGILGVAVGTLQAFALGS
jgi:uncharacterized membrane protein YheB (UPF0754 family)